MRTKNILISGASVAGPAIAFWLNRYGYNTTIIEQASELRPGGYAVDFRGTAIKVLERMGLIDEIKKYETRTEAITIVDKNNKKIVSMPDGFTSGELEIMRGDLARVLYEATIADTEYIFGDTITNMVQDATGVDVTFKYGEPRRFDLVIGADGLHSKVRSIAFGEESEFVHDMGYYISIFTVPNFMNQDRSGLYYGTLGKKTGVFAANGNKEAKASFMFASDPLYYNRRDINEQKEIVRTKFAFEEWKVPQLLNMMDESEDFYFDSISQTKMSTWSSGRIVLIGDAAHCASPMSGMGTSMAVIGAYILAGELMANDDDYKTAFANYEQAMRPLVEKCQKMAEGASWFVPTTRLKLWFSQQIWKILPHTPWKNMMIEMPMKIANSITLKDYNYSDVEAMFA